MDLITRLEQASGPKRTLDALIAKAIGAEIRRRSEVQGLTWPQPAE